MLNKGKNLKCDHIDCGSNVKVWLPHMVREESKGLKSHPYCMLCGTVKNIGTDKAKGRGYFINVISKIDRYLKLPGSSVKMRLIVRELENIEDFDDAYSMSKYNQEKTFINVFKKYYHIPDSTIQQFL